MAEQYGGWPFVAEWNELLTMPPPALRAKLVSRDREMVRLRNSSPFYLLGGIDLGDYDHRGGVPLLINLSKGWLDPHSTRLWYGRLWNSHRTRCISAGLECRHSPCL
jgi:hypothetical protein